MTLSKVRSTMANCGAMSIPDAAAEGRADGSSPRPASSRAARTTSSPKDTTPLLK
jgi:hypothetical protein